MKIINIDPVFSNWVSFIRKVPIIKSKMFKNSTQPPAGQKVMPSLTVLRCYQARKFEMAGLEKVRQLFRTTPTCVKNII